MDEARDRFWYSPQQREWLDYCNANPIFGVARPKRRNYALVENRLVEYTEMSSSEEYDGPDYDDAVFLGRGKYACSDHNVQRYIKRHPEVRANLYVFPDQSTHMKAHYGKLSESELRGFSLVKGD